MANSLFVTFRVDVSGDGVATTVTIDISKHPIFFIETQGSAVPLQLSSEFAPSKPLPTSVDNVTAPGVIGGVTSATLSGRIITVTLASAFTGDFSINGHLHY